MDAFWGLLLALGCGVLAGSFSLPMKKTPKWPWEAGWLIYSLVGLIIIPWATAFTTVPDLMLVYSRVPLVSLTMVVLFGFLWGVGSATFGRSIHIIGISLAFAICLGIVIPLVTIIPMCKDVSVFTTPGGIAITIGVAIMLMGVIVCAIAGKKKEAQIEARSGSSQGSAKMPSRVYIKGLVLAILGGLFSVLLNTAYNFSPKIFEAAQAVGASPVGAGDAIWAMTLTGGYVSNTAYCIYLLTVNKTWSVYREPGTGHYWFLSALMGAIWVCSLIFYGRAAVLMGKLGGSAGWGVYMGSCIIVSNLWGILTGEWKDGKGEPLRIMFKGTALITAAVAIIGYGNWLVSNAGK